MSMSDFLPIIQALIAGAALAITALIGVLVPKAIAAFEARTHIALTDQQREAVRGAALTQAGIIETQLQQGLIKLSEVRLNSPEMMQAATSALARVPDSAKAVGISVPAMAAIIVGAADTATPVAAAVPVPKLSAVPKGPSP